jgi:hypothetical protein
MKVHDGTYFEDRNILSTWNAIVVYIETMKSFDYSHLNNELTFYANIIVIEISVDNLNMYPICTLKNSLDIVRLSPSILHLQSWRSNNVVMEPCVKT